MSEVPAKIAMHDWSGAAHPTLGTRAPAGAVQERLDASPQAMRVRRETVEHPFGTVKARMGATHFLTKTLSKVDTEMALSVLAHNLTRVMNIVGVNRSSQRSGHSGLRSVTHWPTALPRCPTVALRCQMRLFASKISLNADDHNHLTPCGTAFTFSHDQDP